jgi:hypothetical protein
MSKSSNLGSPATEGSVFLDFPTKFVERWSEETSRDPSDQIKEIEEILRFMDDDVPLPGSDLKMSDTIDFDHYISFLQDWLFFGTLTEVFKVVGVHIRQKDFIRDADRKRIITTASLESYLHQWLSREHEILPEASRIERCRAINSILTDATRVCSVFDHVQASFPAMDIFLSISILCLTLMSVWQKVYYQSISIEPSDHQIFGLQSRFLRDKFLGAGWCVNKIDSICGSWPLTLQYYTYQLGPPRSTKNHKSCHRSQCVVNHVNSRTYTTKHLNHPYCSCVFVLAWIRHLTLSYVKLIVSSSPDRMIPRSLDWAMAIPPSSPDMFQDGHWQMPAKELTKIVENGGILLIAFQHPSLDPYDSRPIVTEYNPGCSYFAISHVWADGLGNPRRNSLPLCQLLALRIRLFKLLEMYWTTSRSPRFVAFWIDTLCVPLEPKSVRKKAIMNMHDIYSKSQAVLVLDDGLMQQPCPTDTLEILVRVQTSDWSRRLWTYQEAAFAPRIHFQFRDTPSKDIVDLRCSRSGEENSPGEHYGVTRSVLRIPWFPSFSLRSRSEGRRADLSQEFVEGLISSAGLEQRWRKFFNVWKGLRGRSTSRMHDEIICVAVLLGLDMTSILNIEGERTLDRMKELLKSIKEFPSGMIFVTTRRILEDGYGWAPSSMLQEAKNLDRILFTETPATLLASGLSVRFSGLVFPGNTVQIEPIDCGKYYSRVSDRAHTELGLQNEVPVEKSEPNLLYVFEVELFGHSHRDWRTHEPSSLAVIFQEVIMPQARQGTKTETSGVLVSVLKKEGNIIHVAFKSTVRVAFGFEPLVNRSDHLFETVLNDLKYLAQREYTEFDQQ